MIILLLFLSTLRRINLDTDRMSELLSFALWLHYVNSFVLCNVQQMQDSIHYML